MNSRDIAKNAKKFLIWREAQASVNRPLTEDLAIAADCSRSYAADLCREMGIKYQRGRMGRPEAREPRLDEMIVERNYG